MSTVQNIPVISAVSDHPMVLVEIPEQIPRKEELTTMITDQKLSTCNEEFVK
jgi:hypothetical protein